MRYVLQLILFLAISSCASKTTFLSEKSKNWRVDFQQPKGDLVHRFFFLGGSNSKGMEGLKTTAQLVNSINISDSSRNTILLLGDNGPQFGIPSEENKKYVQAIRTWKGQLSLLKTTKANTIILSGDKEWANGGKKGLQRVKRLNDLIKEETDNISFYPENACPDPVEINISENITLVILNTQWWLQPWERSGIQQDCQVDNEADFLVQLKDILNRNKYKQIIVAGHHPLVSRGKFNGAFSANTHLFPFTEHAPNAYIPLPLLGSLYVTYRKLLGDAQDLKNPKYRLMKNALLKTFESYEGLIYIAGHEELLEFDTLKNNYHIISGSAASSNHFKKKKSEFISSENGFTRLDIYNDKTGILTFLNQQGEELFKKKIPLKYQENKLSNKLEAYLKSRRKNSQAKASTHSFKESKLKKNYTQSWSSVIQNIPFLDFEKTKGGLKVVRRLGGHSVRSLLLENGNGEYFKLYTLERFPQDATPPELKGLFNPETGVSDITAFYPFAPKVISTLANEIGLYAANPELYYVIPSVSLGDYLKDFANRICWLEQVQITDAEYKDMWRKVQHDDEHSVDEVSLLKYRLLDYLVANWGRNENQVKWHATKDFIGFMHYEPRIYTHDFAFFRSENPLYKLNSRRWGMPWLQGFYKDTRDPATFFHKSRYLDRTLLTSLSRQDWEKFAIEIQEQLSDEAIRKAFHFLSDSTLKSQTEKIITTLKYRRDNLLKMSLEWYTSLSKEVDILGSDASEIFEIEKLPANELKISIYRTDDSFNRDFMIYQRIFKASETKEIRLYGFGEKDIFRVVGNENQKILLRIIGGDGKDIIESFEGSQRSKIRVYDTKEGIQLNNKNNLLDRTSSKNSNINSWSREQYDFDVVNPLLFSGFNPDDGLLLGGGIAITKYGFRKNPYKQHHVLEANFAPRTNSFHFLYNAEFIDMLGRWDFLLEGKLNEPGFTRFFYGFGNSTISNQNKRNADSQHYRTRFSEWFLSNSLRLQSENDIHTFEVGASYHAVKVSERFNLSENRRFILDFAEQDPIRENLPLLGKRRHFVSLFIKYKLDTRDNRHLPEQGLHANIEGKITQHLDTNILNYSQLKGAISFFTSFGKSLKTTLAMRLGGGVNFGKFEFYQSNVLGGLQNLRGYRQYRFAGNQSVYQNTELRIQLFNYRTPFAAGTFGFLALHDIGRVWSDFPTDLNRIDNSSDLLEFGVPNNWHRGTGVGVWLSVLPKTVLTTDYVFSNNTERSLFVRLGFMF